MKTTKKTEPAFSTLPQTKAVQDLIRCASAALPLLKGRSDAIELSRAIRTFDSFVTEAWPISEAPVGIDGGDTVMFESSDEEDECESCFIFTRDERGRILLEAIRTGVPKILPSSIFGAARRVAQRRQAFVRVHYAMKDPGATEGHASEIDLSALIPRETVLNLGIDEAFTMYTGLATVDGNNKKRSGSTMVRLTGCDIGDELDCCGERFVGDRQCS